MFPVLFVRVSRIDSPVSSHISAPACSNCTYCYVEHVVRLPGP